MPAANSSTVSVPRRWASMKDTAAHLKITPRTVRAMVADGRLTSYSNGSRLVRIDLNEADAAMLPGGGDRLQT
jgi:excisionase family DNA binding protein